MTFELSPQHADIRDQARTLAQTIDADQIEHTAVVPPAILQSASALFGSDSLALAIVAEEVGAVSAAAGASLAASDQGLTLALSGLRGGAEVESSRRGHLVLSAVALGVARAALDAALRELRQSTATPGADVEKPHWVVADVATEIDAARLLTYKAAASVSDADIALARLMASAAATRAVDAAVRVIGTPALVSGSLVERLSRDVRALSVLIGTEEAQRAMAADGLLPH